MNGVDNTADLGGVLERREYDAPHPPPTERMPAVVAKESRELSPPRSILYFRTDWNVAKKIPGKKSNC